MKVLSKLFLIGGIGLLLFALLSYPLTVFICRGVNDAETAHIRENGRISAPPDLIQWTAWEPISPEIEIRKGWEPPGPLKEYRKGTLQSDLLRFVTYQGRFQRESGSYVTVPVLGPDWGAHPRILAALWPGLLGLALTWWGVLLRRRVKRGEAAERAAWEAKQT